jgi:hypothetical protein
LCVGSLKAGFGGGDERAGRDADARLRQERDGIPLFAVVADAGQSQRKSAARSLLEQCNQRRRLSGVLRGSRDADRNQRTVPLPKVPG